MGNEKSDLGGVADDVKDAWHRYLDILEPLRPELYRYARALTRSAWDAEELAQDALARGFVTLGGPEVLAEVCGELKVPWRSNGYRYWPRSG
jgi:Sigma-70 region 2